MSSQSLFSRLVHVCKKELKGAYMYMYMYMLYERVYCVKYVLASLSLVDFEPVYM